ncbi:ionotropic receptor 21a-like [Panulirus ornatus]|uniref:ionotropic receptor 21a-like n=1 Tax=Panulirus ornatus TaxID=150431 RepID=UPI003A84FCED
MRKVQAMLLITLVFAIYCGSASRLPIASGEQVKMLDPYWAAGVVLRATPRLPCSVILLTEDRDSSSPELLESVVVRTKMKGHMRGMESSSARRHRSDTVATSCKAVHAGDENLDCQKVIELQGVDGGCVSSLHVSETHLSVAVFRAAVDGQDANMTQAQLTRVIVQARRVRQSSRCVTVVVVSDDPAFLATFAQFSLKGRLLGSSTRLLVVTRLPLPELRNLLISHWTFSMMNSVFLVLHDVSGQPGFGVYVSLPYSANGPMVVKVAFWMNKRGLLPVSQLNFFPQKFTNFYRATVNVTALPYRPYWSVVDDVDSDGTIVKRYTGSDARLLMTIAQALNFTFRVLPVTTWDQVTARVVERASFMASIYHIVLPQRQLRHDFTYTYEHVFTDFALAKPSLSSNWQSLYDPLADVVWASVLLAVLVVPILLFVITRPLVGDEYERKMGVSDGAQVVIATLLAQSIIKKFPRGSSGRVLVATWLVFAFIIGTAYRGNLTASLTLPKYPPRPETIEQLVKFADKVTMPPYGEQFLQFFKQSDSNVFQSLSKLMEIVPTASDGLRQASRMKEAFMDGRRYLQQMIADHFTRSDGSTQLYIGRESVLPGIAAWPIPHDAPYKPQVDHLMMRVIEAGLYEKWIGDMLYQARQEGRRRQLEYQQQQYREAVGDADYGGKLKALSLRHIQGPFILLFLGLCLSCITSATESVVQYITLRHLIRKC